MQPTKGHKSESKSSKILSSPLWHLASVVLDLPCLLTMLAEVEQQAPSHVRANDPRCDASNEHSKSPIENDPYVDRVELRVSVVAKK